MSRTWRLVVTSGVIAALIAPVVVDRDGIPLSTYPMYARTRGETVSLVTANGIDSEGRRVRLGLQTIGSSDDPLIVAGELRSAVNAGRADDRCTRIADRVERPADTDEQDDVATPAEPTGEAAGDVSIVAVEIVTERHDVVARTEGGSSLIERSVHARCTVVATGRTS